MSDIVDGKAVRDFKTGEIIVVDTKELENLPGRRCRSRNVVTHRYCTTLACNIKIRVIITAQHAHSLSELVKWFKKMIEQSQMPDTPGRSDELTVGYCDELIRDLLEEGE